MLTGVKGSERTVHPDELESRIDRELRRLSAPRAPRTLLPRVMAAIAMAQRPWYARGWRTWPLGWQLASATAGLVGLAAMWVVGPSLIQLVTAPVSGGAGPVGRGVVDGLTRLAEFRRDVAILWRVVVAPLATLALVPLAVMCAATMAFGVALGRLMSLTQEASQS